MSNSVLAIYSPYFGSPTPLLQFKEGKLSTVSASARKGYYFDVNTKAPVYYNGSANQPLLPAYSAGTFCTVVLDREDFYPLSDWFTYFRLSLKRKEIANFNSCFHQDFCLGIIDYAKKADLPIKDSDVSRIYNRLLNESFLPESLSLSLLRPYFEKGSPFTASEWESALRSFNMDISDNFEFVEFTTPVDVCTSCGSIYPSPYISKAILGELASPFSEEGEDFQCDVCGSETGSKVMLLDYMVNTVANSHIIEYHKEQRNN